MTRPTDQAPLRRSLSNVLAVAYKEAMVLRHDRALVAMVFAQPIMMMLLFGLALSNKPANVPWAVLDRSQTAESRRLVREIESTGYFLSPTVVNSYDEGQSLLHHGHAVVFLVVPETLRRDQNQGRGEVQLLVDGSDPLSAARVAGYVNNVAAHFRTHADTRPTGPSAGMGRVDLSQSFWFNPTLRDRNFFLAILGGMLLTNFCLSISSLGLVGERENGTYEQILSLPTRPLEIVLGKLLPYVGISYVVLVFALVVSGLCFGLWPQGSWLSILVVSLPFILSSLAAGAFVSTLAHTSSQAVFISVFFILPSFVLSGSMFPYQLMPDGVRQIGGIFPLRWYQIALRRVISRGSSFHDILGPIAMLSGIFLILVILIQRRMKPRLG